MPPQYKPKPNIQTTVQKLMASPVLSQARKKAILTLAHRRNTTRENAKLINSQAIAKYGKT